MTWAKDSTPQEGTLLEVPDSGAKWRHLSHRGFLCSWLPPLARRAHLAFNSHEPLISLLEVKTHSTGVLPFLRNSLECDCDVLIVFPPKNVEVLSRVTVNVILFGNRVSADVIKLK